MGMDFNIYSSHNHEVFKHEEWWQSPQVEEMFYTRKCWDWVEHCNFIPKNYENGDFIELTLDNLNELIKVATEYKNYWGNYDDLPKLCELRDKYMEWEENGDPRKLYYEYDW